MADLFEPNWRTIEDSKVRKEQELPWYADLIDGAAETGLNAKDMQEMSYWRGYREALTFIRDFPGEAVAREEAEALEAERQQKERENAGRRSRWGTRWLRRADGA